MTLPKDHNISSRGQCEQLDRADTLAFARERFVLPDALPDALPNKKIYLDGNSLGALPRATPAAVEQAIRHDWGQNLIASWNTADWVNLPVTVGAKLAPLLGAASDEVVIADSTSINIFKLLAGVLLLPNIANDPKRNVILSERDNFPTDLYMAEGINALLGNRYMLKLVDGDDVVTSIDDSVAVALITQVNYRTGRIHDMAALNRAAANAGTHIVWDLSHSAGAIPLQLNDAGAEFAVGCGYKYLNGGPGAPGYLYVTKNMQSRLSTPLSGWFGHKTPFQFSVSYLPADNIQRFLCGTPSVLATVALQCGLDCFADVSMADIRAKSLALTDLYWALMDAHCGDFGFRCISPREHDARGSQLSFAHDHAYEIMQAIIERGVVGDFRQPNIMRFGFTPLYTRFVDCWDAVMIIREVMLSGAWKAPKYRERLRVT
jgi:kynureninase